MVWGFPAFPGGLVGKESTCKIGDAGLIPGLRRSPGEGSSTPLQYSYLENSTDRGAWWGTVHGVTKSQMWLSTHTHTHTHIKCLHAVSHFNFLYAQESTYLNEFLSTPPPLVGVLMNSEVAENNYSLTIKW